MVILVWSIAHIVIHCQIFGQILLKWREWCEGVSLAVLSVRVEYLRLWVPIFVAVH